MTKHSRPKQRAAHMHPYRRDKRQGPRERRDTSDRVSGTREQPGNTRNNAPQADRPQADRPQAGRPQAGRPQASASIDDDDDDGNKVPLRPQPQLFGQLRILPSATISLVPSFVVGNPRKSGPQTDICARVPGHFNTWVARISCKDTYFDFGDLVLSNSGRKSPRIYVVWEHCERTYSFREYEQKMQLNNHADCNFIFWTNESDTRTGSHDEGTHLEGPIIPGILGEEGMKMVDRGVVEESCQWQQ